MNEANMSDSNGMTPERCYQFCTGHTPPFKYAGLEDSRQCFCGNTLPQPSPTVPAFCNATVPPGHCDGSCKVTPPTQYCCCSGDASKPCGGVGILDVYDVSGYRCKIVPVAAAFCNATLSVGERVASLIDSMTAAEKAGCLTTRACQLPRLGLAMSWKESLHGLRFNCIPDLRGRTEPLCATSFPHAQLLAASFNRSLWRAVGAGIATEARAWYNVYLSGRSASLVGSGLTGLSNSFFAPDINLCRDPRWGRCLEVPGEDPFLTGEYAMAYVGAMQTRDPTGRFTKTLCNAKHWSAYDVEKGSVDDGRGPTYNRGDFDARVSRRDLTETFFPQFRAAVAGAGLGGAMCSYNAVCTPGLNGSQCVPSCANDVFNNDILRGQLGFTGMIVSDCGAITGIGPAQHNFSQKGHETRAGLRGGCDLNCGTVYKSQVDASLASGLITEEDVTRALNRSMTQLISLGMAEASPPWGHLNESDIDSPPNRQTALDAARQGMVLLKNEGGLLPLRSAGPSSRLKVAVLGPHFNSSTHLLANYYGENHLVLNSTPLLGLRRRSEVEVIGAVAGCDLLNATAEYCDIAAAARIAEAAEVAIVFAGLHSTDGPQEGNGPGMEREGYDRTNLTMPGLQTQLVQAIVATGTPTVVVLINSGGLAASWIYDNVPAVIEAYYPGELGGDAMASLLLGDVSPAGRLVTTIYPAAYVAERNITDMELRAHAHPTDAGAPEIPGATYRFYPESRALFPFGYGRSYTTFRFGWNGPSAWNVTTDDAAQALPAYYAGAPLQGFLPSFNLSVTNTGGRVSDVSVLCFVSSAAAQAPLKQLAAFGRVRGLGPGQTVSLSLTPAPCTLTTVDERGDEYFQNTSFRVDCGGAPDGFVYGHLAMDGEARRVFTLPRD